MKSYVMDTPHTLPQQLEAIKWAEKYGVGVGDALSETREELHSHYKYLILSNEISGEFKLFRTSKIMNNFEKRERVNFLHFLKKIKECRS